MKPVSVPPLTPRPTTQAIAEDVADLEQPPQPVESPKPAPPAGVNLRSPYTAAEWKAISAALRAERTRREKRGLPFYTAREQMAVLDDVLLPMRRPSYVVAKVDQR